MGRIQLKLGVGKQVWFVPNTGAGSGKFCDFFSHLSLETVFPALKLTQNYHKNITFENWQFSHKLGFPPSSINKHTVSDRLISQSVKI